MGRVARRRSLRPAGFDDLGLRHALADRMLPGLVAAMAFLAALAIGAWTGAASLARGWQEGAAASLTIQVPQPDEQADGGSRADGVLATLRATPGVDAAHRLTGKELARLLRPWLGTEAAQLDLPLPGVIAVRLGTPPPDLESLSHRMDAVAPGTILEREEVWAQRLERLVGSLQLCSGLALVVVAGVAAAVIAVATRGGLAARRDAIEIVHGLGATDSYIAGRFAGRAAMLAAIGGAAGGALALPMLLGLARLAAPFTNMPRDAGPLELLPPGLSMVLVGLPLVAGGIGWLTAQVTVRAWVRRLP
jgi:cell division transport system permease protein